MLNIFFYHHLFNYDVTKQNVLWVKSLQYNDVPARKRCPR